MRSAVLIVGVALLSTLPACKKEEAVGAMATEVRQQLEWYRSNIDWEAMSAVVEKIEQQTELKKVVVSSDRRYFTAVAIAETYAIDAAYSEETNGFSGGNSQNWSDIQHDIAHAWYNYLKQTNLSGFEKFEDEIEIRIHLTPEVHLLWVSGNAPESYLEHYKFLAQQGRDPRGDLYVMASEKIFLKSERR